MGLLRRAIKWLAVGCGVVVMLYVVVLNFSTVETRLKCTGELVSEGVTEPITVFAEWTRYRWWVGLWSESDGMLWVEIPHKAVDAFTHVTESSHTIFLWDQGKQRGQLSLLSMALSVQFGSWGYFQGLCKGIGEVDLAVPREVPHRAP